MTGSIWSARAARLLDQARDRLQAGDDPLPEITAAEMALRIEAGERSPDDMEGYPFPGENEDETESCICPPDLRAHGGFTSACGCGGGRRV